MNGYINRHYRDGAVIGTRVVFYQGKRWHVSIVRPEACGAYVAGRHFSSVFSTNNQNYPRTFGSYL